MDRRALEDEMRGALEEEIAHLQKTQSERTVAATGGSRSGAAGPWVLYTFLLERDFLVPDATPVVVQIGNERINGQIVAIQGMEITLGLRRDLGPTIARVEISVDPSAILERILARLEDPAISRLSDTLARMVFGYDRPRFGRSDFESKVDISDEKRLALSKAIGSQVQFIWGPPGTGKTQALAALCEVLVENGESVLLASHTNVAVDEAILRAAGPPIGDRRQGPLFQTPAYFEGKLLRYGPPKHAEFARIIDELSAEAIAKRLSSSLEARLSEIEEELEEIGDARRLVDELLEDWRKAERFGEEVLSRQRAHDGAVASLNKRQAEYDAAGATLTRARERLEDALNPRGLRRLFRKDPRPFELAVDDAKRSLATASESLSAAQDWELQARTALDEGRAHVSELTPAVPMREAQRRLGELDAHAERLDQERRRTQTEIDRIIETVIGNAQFVGTTLTRAATDEVLSKRTFDTVIIDEASMAPLPLVYLVALVAEKRVILVGDFRQLPPIVQAPRDNELAHKWLGRDIFEQADLHYPRLAESKLEWRSDLWRQHRMAPAIRQFASDQFYDGRLADYDEGDRPEDETWAERDPSGRQVCLVDTTSLGAWSQRSPGARPSKFNIYSALVATELAQLLVNGLKMDATNSGSRPVGIVTPYRAQANLLRALLEERGLTASVHAGTVHSFQGTESEVIIFDYVEEKPYWKAGPLLLGDSGERLLNVAVTRARNRLFVVGSYAHVRQQLKKSKLWDLVEYAREIQQINAEEFLRTDFHRAVADANARIRHGNIVDLDNAQQLRVLSERDFFAALDYDLIRAKSRVVLFSPFLGRRAADVMPRLKECVARGIAVYVVTRPLADVDAGEMRKFYAATHRRLEQLGVKLVFFREMHHKLVFIDDRILYIGGLNPLSHRHTAEIMDRWDSKDVFKIHAQQTRLDDLLAMWEDPNDKAMRTCPRPQCKGARLLIVAPVTYQQYDPIYWGCTNYPKCSYVRRFAHGPRRSGQRICDKCGTAMRLERKPSAVWWVCPSCRARRKVQEGEPTQLELGAKIQQLRRIGARARSSRSRRRHL